MSERSNNLADEQLVAHIEALLSGEAAAQPDDSRARFASYVAQTRPLLNQAHRAELEQRLLVEWQRLLGGAGAPATPATATRRDRRIPGWRRGLMAITALLLLLLVFSPAARLVAADMLDGLQRLSLSIRWGPDGLRSIHPMPPFAVKQLGYHPAGLELVGDRYAPLGDAGVEGQLMQVDPQTRQPDPWVQEVVERDRGPAPHLLLVYRSGGQQYAALFQRGAQPGEPLPAGMPRSVNGQPAVLQQAQRVLRLIWIEAGTWLELETTLDEAELQRMAEGLVPFERPAAAVPPSGQRWGDWLRQSGRPPACPGVEKAPTSRLLGSLAGQDYLGSVRIELLNNGEREWEHISTGASVPNGGRQVLESALAALRQPGVSVQELPYAAVVSYRHTRDEPCLRPNPDIQGYYVVEVWSGQVLVGGKGHTPALLQRAIKALEQQL